LAMRFPDEAGNWSRSWREKTIRLRLPGPVISHLKQGEAAAPTLREIQEADGDRYAVLHFILKVPNVPEGGWDQVQHVLAFGWGGTQYATCWFWMGEAGCCPPPLPSI